MSSDQKMPESEGEPRVARDPLPTNVQQVHQYTSHNFDAMNRAIDGEVQKQELWSAVYYGQRVEKAARAFFYVIVGVSALAVSAALIWWLLFPAHPSFYADANSPLSHDGELRQLSQYETVEASEAPFIDTSFTVFHRSLIPSGEYVVTGKTYAPNALSFPLEQYCYLETIGGEKLEGVPLAAYDGTDFSAETEDANLISYAEQYCRFSRGE